MNSDADDPRLGTAGVPIARVDDIPQPSPLPAVRHVAWRAPFGWLSRGWRDLVATRFIGAFYGAAFVAMGYAIVAVYTTRWQLTMGLVGGFFLMGPFVCTGLYELSRQRARGEPPSLLDSMTCWRRNAGSIALFAVALAFLMIVWARVSVILFALASSAELPTLQGVLGSILTLENARFVLPWAGVGFGFASLVFAIGVVSVPLMLDRDVDAARAVATSARCLFLSPAACYVWAALVVTIIGASLALAFVPLLLTAPLVGHATWHAYADMVAPADGAA